MKLLMSDYQDNKEEWLRLKQSTIGSSEIAVICGLNKYRSVLELWAEKTGKIEPFKGNRATYLGTVIEPAIAHLFAEDFETSLEVQPSRSMYAHDTIEGISATPDFFLVDKLSGEVGNLEVKNTSWRSLKEWEENAPFWAQIQLQWQMGICNTHYGFVSGMVGANAFDLKSYRFEFSPQIFEMAYNLTAEFWEYVKKDIPPDAGPGDKKLVEKIIGEREKGKITALGLDCYPIVKNYMKMRSLRKALEEQVKTAKKEEDALEARIRQLMGDACKTEKLWGVKFSISNYNVDPKVVEGYSVSRFTASGEFEKELELEPQQEQQPIEMFEQRQNG